MFHCLLAKILSFLADLQPLGPDAATWLDETFEELARREPAAAAASGSAPRSDRGAAVPVMFGRELLVSRAAGGVACFTFDELCNRPLGAPDYMALATQFHTVCLSEVPQLSIGQRDQARRFIVLVDELYNRGCKLFMTTEVTTLPLSCVPLPSRLRHCLSLWSSGRATAAVCWRGHPQLQAAGRDARARRDDAVRGRGDRWVEEADGRPRGSRARHCK